MSNYVDILDYVTPTQWYKFAIKQNSIIALKRMPLWRILPISSLKGIYIVLQIFLLVSFTEKN